MSELENPTAENEVPERANLNQEDDSADLDATEPNEASHPDWKKLYGDSSREAKRLVEEIKNARNESALYQQQLAQALYALQSSQQAPQQVREEEADFSDDDVEALSEALFNQDKEKIKKVFGKVVSSAAAASKKDINKQSAEQREITASLQYVAQHRELNDPNSPLTKAVYKNYYEIVSNPYEMAGLKQAAIPFGGQQINPHALKLAVLKAKSSVGAVQGQISADRAAADGNIEGGSRSNSITAGGEKATFNPNVHLSKEERKYCTDMQRRGETSYTYKHYWDFLEKAYPGIQSTRLKRGEPVSATHYRRGSR